MICRISLFFFFFFQAEDGIRDVAVTGVQTCALPISAAVLRRARLPGVHAELPLERRLRHGVHGAAAERLGWPGLARRHERRGQPGAPWPRRPEPGGHLRPFLRRVTPPLGRVPPPPPPPPPAWPPAP